MENNEYEVLQVQHDQNIVQLDAVERANVDSQVATAKQYPRNGLCILFAVASEPYTYRNHSAQRRGRRAA